MNKLAVLGFTTSAVILSITAFNIIKVRMGYPRYGSALAFKYSRVKR